MAEARVERRLAAILAADVAGYSRLMGTDEVGTLAALKAHRRDVVDPAIAAYHGRIVKTTGDGMLVEFASAVDAVTCAVALQEKMAERVAEGSGPRIQFRVGINVGDIIIDGGDIFGDGVNVAARVENECAPGGVCLSDDAYRQVRSKTAFAFDDLGERLLKNIDRPVRIYAVRSAAYSVAAAVKSPVEPGKPLPLPDRPSIAVLPFTNMSGDPEQEYFADGMVEDIITALSRFKSLFVIARNSSFTYKGKSVDVKQVGRELGVRYVLEGSVRKAGGRVRITGQLIDCTTGAHLWADRFEGRLEDVFELQDEVATSVVGELVTEMQFAEMERVARKPTGSLDAYDCYLRGLSHELKWNKDDAKAAFAYFLQAIELDEHFALAHAWAGLTYNLRKQNRWMEDVARESAEAIRLARRAIELGHGDDLALCMGGFVLAYIGGELDFGAECIRRGLSMNPNLAMGWEFSGYVHILLGKPQTALEHLHRAERLNPRSPSMIHVQLAVTAAHFFDGQYEEAACFAEAMTRAYPTFLPAWRYMAVSNALGGDQTLVAKATEKALELDPTASVSVLASEIPLRRPEDRERWKEGLIRAGFPQ
ncbi:adenylate/guanylate cyclase domain-containing protein [Bradyrhizobium erythrophlei]|uniref:adenylate/guanylate cyclase domain-containing protein n=1 Tax=Bradyrhizobium erythrophlei TaxID=1437360 RepID=UPI0035E98242